MASEILSAKNILEILKRLNEGQILHLKLLAEEMQMSSRNVERYFATIRAVFPDAFNKDSDDSGGFYRPNKPDFNLNSSFLVMSAIVYSLMPKKEFNKMFNALDNEGKKILKKEMKKVDKIYKFITKPFEDIDSEIFKSVERCVKFNQQMSLEYDNTVEKRILTVKPYKIVFIDENFYLACLDGDKFLMLRIGFIKNVKILNNFNHTNKYIDDFINEGLQTSFSNFDDFKNGNFIEVKLKVSKNIARYFTPNKKFFSTQSVKELENGEKVVTYRVTQLKEIMPFVKKWLPDIEVIEPARLKDKILEDILEYQKRCSKV